MKLSVSDCGHFFQSDDGSPFFYLADTVWMLFNKLTEDEVRDLFRDRASKGFTVIQSVVFRDLFTPNSPNAYGVRPFSTEEDMRAVRMNPEWIAYVKRIVSIAEEYGLVMGLLPTWGDKWNEHSNSAGPVIMDGEKARVYGRYLSDALSPHENVIWILGGDSPIQSQYYADVVIAMAEGIRSGGSADRLMTFHPSGSGSSDGFHNARWLDFDAIQTSHHRPNIPGYLYIERLYANHHAKPCIDMEPNYEASPMFIMQKHREGAWGEPLFSAYDVRKSYYRTVFAGAAGFTYGCEPIRQLHRSGDRIHIHTGYDMPTWEESLSNPGSFQLSMLVELLEGRSYFTRVPAQELFIPHKEYGAWPDRVGTGLAFTGQQNVDPVSHISVTRCRDESFIMAYLPVRQVLTLDTTGMSGGRLRVSLYDPEACKLAGSYDTENAGRVTLVPLRDLDSLIIIDAI